MSQHLAGLRLQDTELDDNALLVKQDPVSIIINLVRIFHFQ